MIQSLHLAKHGEEVYLLSALGADTLGARARDCLLQWGIHTDYVVSLENKPPGQCLVTLDGEGMPSYRVLEDVAFDHIPTQIPSHDCDVLYFGTIALRGKNNRQAIASLLAEHRFSTVFVDVNIRPPFYSAETVAFAVAHATMLKISEEELPTVAALLGLSPVMSYQDLAHTLQERYKHLKCIIVTLGAKGAYALKNGKEYACAASPATVASTVGAGDSFSAAFLHCYLQGDDISSALAHAAKVAGFVVSQTDAVPDYDPAAL